MVTRTVEYCSLNQVSEQDVLQLLSQVLAHIEPQENATSQPVVQWTHLGRRDGRTPDGHSEVVDSFRASLTRHFDLRKEVAQRFIETQFGPVQLSDRISYIATGQGDNFHFELYVNADGHNTVHFMISALPDQVDRFLDIFHTRFQ